MTAGFEPPTLRPPPLVATTQRLFRDGDDGRSDGLDQAWTAFLGAVGAIPIPLPNDHDAALALMRDTPVEALLLTGGNPLARYGGDAPERDAVELALIEQARRWAMPIIGVDRGMQLIQHVFGDALTPLSGHQGPRCEILVGDTRRHVCAQHTEGAFAAAPCLKVWARSADGVVKAIRHRAEPIVAMMWRPERMRPFDPHDLAVFHGVLGADASRAA